MTAGIREVKNNLSYYVREVKKGKRVALTEHGRVVAELVPPSASQQTRSRIDELIEKGLLIPAKKKGPLPKLATRPLVPPGTALAELDASRNEDHEWP